MKKSTDTVSIVIPTKNSAGFLESCLRCIRLQTYPNIEIVIVDGKSTDNVKMLAKKYQCQFYTHVPKVKKGVFDAPHKRNYGAKKAVGKYIYWLDADMELPKNLISEAVTLCSYGADAVILPEDSYGIGIWSQAKRLERRCYWNDNSMESPRFYKKSVWDDIGGFDLSLGAGGDDLDLSQKLLEKGYIIKRTKNIVLHNEGNLSINKSFKKHFMYGREMFNYLKKRPRSWIVSYNPFKSSYLRHWKLFLTNPLTSFFFIILRTTEYVGGAIGFLYSFFESKNKALLSKKTKQIDYSDYLCQYYDTNIPELLKKYLKIASYTTLLDLGCGDGALLYALKKQGYLKRKEIFAIDLSPKSIALVKKIDKKIHAYVDNAEKIKTIKKNGIDFIISTMLIEHIDDKKMLASIDRILNKKGVVYLTTVFKKPYGWYYNRRNGKWVMDVTHLREYTKDEQLIKLINKNKYRVLVSKKSLIWFPVLDFIFRRLIIKNRSIFLKNPVFNLMRKISIPVIGYYRWEIILRKKNEN